MNENWIPVTTFEFTDCPLMIRASLFFLLLALSPITAFLSSGCRTLEEGEGKAGRFDQAMFAAADTDGDGKLSKPELALHQHREALAEIDLDDDSQISAAEWAAAKPSAGENDQHFKQLDKNNDGKVAEDEAVSFITEDVEFGDSFQKLDTNGDSHLHWEEIEAGSSAELNETLFSTPPNA